MPAPRIDPDQVPADAEARRAAAPVLVYPPQTLPAPDLALYVRARGGARRTAQVVVPPRDARAVEVPAGSVLRIECREGSQVGDLNLFRAGDLSERFFSGKTRALHGTHVSVGDRLWSCLPYLRPMATILADSLAWYGRDADGGGVHDVIGTRCDPYTQRLLGGTDYHHCCHSNLTRALVAATGLPVAEAEAHVHDVLNVFMCTGFTADEGRYFMKASPARAGDFVELFAEIDLLALLSTCPGGDCGSGHSSDEAVCHPLVMEVWEPEGGALDGWAPPEPSGYDRGHGIG
ncbi:urea carboxylase-associated family protein [Wenxinia marina]|uniref:DUF1989 domain-containing protein n=1 Tax=Wenxinia marina DSM 24838 TaxID=1123501 RepID=A0A0D0QHG0_9RHOB|nr:DUF1989 domain-containing protein [Wenxinia marina]KIQ70508.1 hypothetical protein Wenmar_00884 [Wenxinia marina DSM 24838]GGL52565.1 hypothetical protein GCM10011392_03670 [Wenxinia marina]